MSRHCNLTWHERMFYSSRAEDAEMAEMHKIALSPDVVTRVKKRRGGKLHAFDRSHTGEVLDFLAAARPPHVRQAV
jgi:hypothetical protein